MKKLAKVLSLTLALVMCAVILTACGASADSMKKKYEDAGYTVGTMTAEDMAKYGFEESDVEWAQVATKQVVNTAFIICFKDAKKAEEVKNNTPLVKTKLDGKVLILALTDNALEAK